MKNKTLWIIGGVIVFLILLAIIGSSGSNNSPSQTASNNQPSLCSDITSLKNQATAVNFKELDKDPNSFNGKIAKFTGQILQIQESNGYGVIRLAVTKESYGWSSADVVYVEYQGHTDAVEDDVVTAYGQLTGSKTYESQAHFEITVPSMTACVVEKGTSATSAQTPPATQPAAQKTTSRNQIQTQTTQKPATPPKPSVPAEYTSALAQADSYANTMHMSKQGVYDQLVSEYGGQFSAAAAQYAINNIQADWNNNALLQAEDYQNTMHLSPKAIYDQLTSQYGAKFTADEANYAIQHLSN
jgi:hypothetical protein